MDLIDTATFSELQQTAGHEFVAELVDTFVEELPAMLAELQAAQAGGDALRWRRAAHSLKSNGLSFGALRLAQQARDMELGGLPTDAAPLLALSQLAERTLLQLREAAGGR